MLAQLALIGLAHSGEHKVCLRRDLWAMRCQLVLVGVAKIAEATNGRAVRCPGQDALDRRAAHELLSLPIGHGVTLSQPVPRPQL